MNEDVSNLCSQASGENEIILYSPDSNISLEVRLENETVWLTQQQIADLFGTKRPAITKHLANIYKSGELEEDSTCSILEHMGNNGVWRYEVKYYNLDAILSVGYRVNSRNATLFRRWANKVLREYLLRGYSVNQRLLNMESRLDRRLSEHDSQIKELNEKIDVFVKTSLPPREGVFFDGQIFDVYTLMCDLIRSATKRIFLIDNYIDDSVFRQLDKRAEGVVATIFTPSINMTLQQDLERHNSQYSPIDIRIYRKAHDRFLIIDDAIYHIGASLKDLGKKLFAFTKLEVLTVDELMRKVLEVS